MISNNLNKTRLPTATAAAASSTLLPAARPRTRRKSINNNYIYTRLRDLWKRSCAQQTARGNNTTANRPRARRNVRSHREKSIRSRDVMERQMKKKNLVCPE